MTLRRVLEAAKQVLRDILSEAMALRVGLRWRRHAGRQGKPSGLPHPLVLSLTSYPPRFPTLAATLKSLLMQSVQADHVELWIAEKDMAALPQAVLELRAHGLSIRACSDLRSYKKIIPALSAHPDAVIVTADDDAYYWPTWLEELVAAYDPDRREVLCHRGHRIALRGDGLPAPYRTWEFDTPDGSSSLSTFPTGLGGVLYRPGILPAEAMREDLFRRYCPTGDDIWLFWMVALNGARFRKVGPVRRFILWRGGQDVALYNQNVVGEDGNDIQIAAMIEAYGFPPAVSSREEAAVPSPRVAAYPD
ncbi:hypothetical protein ACMDCR_25465 [Labrys okinawensis]|uniref:hypothetical protein n=1 Tax=Labrys okinawensis TaxID=346911 RepID=UPI0039BCE28B